MSKEARVAIVAILMSSFALSVSVGETLYLRRFARVRPGEVGQCLVQQAEGFYGWGDCITAGKFIGSGTGSNPNWGSQVDSAAVVLRSTSSTSPTLTLPSDYLTLDDEMLRQPLCYVKATGIIQPCRRLSRNPVFKRDWEATVKSEQRTK